LFVITILNEIILINTCSFVKYINFWNEHQPYFKTRVLPTPDQSLIIFLGVRTAPGLGKKETFQNLGGGERNPSGNYIHPWTSVAQLSEQGLSGPYMS
jgi:hypothetical protein